MFELSSWFVTSAWPTLAAASYPPPSLPSFPPSFPPLPPSFPSSPPSFPPSSLPFLSLPPSCNSFLPFFLYSFPPSLSSSLPSSYFPSFLCSLRLRQDIKKLLGFSVVYFMESITLLPLFALIARYFT